MSVRISQKGIAIDHLMCTKTSTKCVIIASDHHYYSLGCEKTLRTPLEAIHLNYTTKNIMPKLIH